MPGAVIIVRLSLFLLHNLCNLTVLHYLAEMFCWKDIPMATLIRLFLHITITICAAPPSIWPS